MIIPTVLEKDFKKVKEKIKLVEDYVKWVQLDIMDGVFVNNETWNKPQRINTKVKLEAHLMVQNPEKIIDDWLKIVDRIIIHFESTKEVKKIIDKVHKKKKQIGLALNPETDIAAATPFLKDLDLVLIMTIQPGWGGQELKPWTLDKVKFLRKKWKGDIQVDGGVNNENIKKIRKAGANLICVGTYIFSKKDIKKAIESLK